MLKRFKVLGSVVLAVFALGAVASSASSAAMILPEFTVQTNGTDASGAGTFFGAAEIKCTKDTSTLTMTSKKGGTFSIDFMECTAFGEECHSLGDKADSKGGLILTGGNWTLELDVLGGVDHRLVLLEPKELHIECKFLNSLVVVRGKVLGTIVPKAGTTNQFIIKVSAKGKTEQEFKEFENNNGEKVTEHLESSLDEGAFEESGETAGEDVLTTEKNTELVN